MEFWTVSLKNFDRLVQNLKHILLKRLEKFLSEWTGEVLSESWRDSVIIMKRFFQNPGEFVSQSWRLSQNIGEILLQSWTNYFRILDRLERFYLNL